MSCLFFMSLGGILLSLPFVQVAFSITSHNTCWSLELANVLISQNETTDFELVSNYPSLDHAKTFCELMGTRCFGVTRLFVRIRGDFRYAVRTGNQLIGSIESASWIKQECHAKIDSPSILPISPVLGIRTSSVYEDFYRPLSTCEQATAESDLGEIRKIRIWGERNSGTNLLQTLLESKTSIAVSSRFKHQSMDKAVLRGYERAISKSALHILITKDAFSWIRSMHKNPHHLEPLKTLPLEAFLLTEWNPLFVQSWEPWLKEDNYANIFQLRVAKLKSWLGFKGCLPFTYHIRYEDLLDDSNSVIGDLIAKFSLPKREATPKTPDTICDLKGGACQSSNATDTKKFYREKKYLQDYSALARSIVKENLDFRMEKELGYDYGYVK